MNNKVEWWYRQNLFLVVKDDHALAGEENIPVLPLVHPELFESVSNNRNLKINRLEKNIARLQKRDIVGRVSRILKGKNK